MMTICQMCGDRGFSEALIYCDKCEVYAQHRYCLEVLPRTFDEYVIWFCADCKPKSAKPKVCVNSENEQVETKVCVNLVNVEAKPEVCVNSESAQAKPKVCVNPESEHTHQSKGMSSKKRKRVYSKNKKRTRKNITSSMAKTEQQRCVDSASVQAEPKVCVNSESVQAKSKVCVNSVSVNTTQSKRKNSRKRGNNKNRKRKRKDITSSVAKTEQQRCEGRTGHQSYGAHCGEDCEKDQKFGKQGTLVLEDGGNSIEKAEYDKSKTSQITISDSTNILEHRVHSHPIIDPIWRGSISIRNEHSGTFGKLLAHISSLACQKVWETANLLPKLLCPELLPRPDVWPKGFENSGPRDDNIALYFFPDSERDEKVFDSMVEDMIAKDLALKAVVENAELLVFPSTELPLQYWRFQSKLYLWGVFRQKQVSHLGNGHVVPRVEKEPVKRITWSKQSPTTPLQQW